MPVWLLQKTGHKQPTLYLVVISMEGWGARMRALNTFMGASIRSRCVLVSRAASCC